MPAFDGNITMPMPTGSGDFVLSGLQYATIEQANMIMSQRLNTGIWDQSSVSDKQKALKMGTKAIDRLRYLGIKADSEQLLQFPRDGDTSPPSAIVEASVLCAVEFLGGYDSNTEQSNLFLTGQTYASVSATYDRKSVSENILAGIPSYEAWMLIYPYLQDNDTLTLVRV